MTQKKKKVGTVNQVFMFQQRWQHIHFKINPTAAHQSLKQEVKVSLTVQISKWTINDLLRTHRTSLPRLEAYKENHFVHQLYVSLVEVLVVSLSLFGSAWVDRILDQGCISSGFGRWRYCSWVLFRSSLCFWKYIYSPWCSASLASDQAQKYWMCEFKCRCEWTGSNASFPLIFFMRFMLFSCVCPQLLFDIPGESLGLAHAEVSETLHREQGYDRGFIGALLCLKRTSL